MLPNLKEEKEKKTCGLALEGTHYLDGEREKPIYLVYAFLAYLFSVCITTLAYLFSVCIITLAYLFSVCITTLAYLFSV